MTPKDGNLLLLLHDHVAQAPDAPQYTFLSRHGQETLTLSRLQLWVAATILAARLQARSLQRQPLILCFSHGPEFVVAFWASILAGAWPLPVPLPRSADCRQLRALLCHSKAAALLTSSARRPALVSALADRLAAEQVLAVDPLPTEASASSAWAMPAVRADDVAFVQYTSGSTAEPRGVVISHRNICQNARQIAVAFGCHEADRGLSWLPFHHDMGLIGHVVQPVFSRLHNYFMNPADFVARPLSWLQAIDRYQVSISGGPNFAYQWCCERIATKQLATLDLSAWRLAYCGAEPLQPRTLRRFIRHVGSAGFSSAAVYPCYGLAEATLFVTGRAGLHPRSVSNEAGQRLASCGHAAAGAEVRIMDGDTGHWLPDGKKGEICVCSASLSPGYFRDRPSTGQRYFERDGRRWLRTHDLGFLRAGELFVSGRLSNSFKYCGRSLQGEDIEQTALRIVCSALCRRCILMIGDAGADGAPHLLLLFELRRPSDTVLGPDLRCRLMQGLNRHYGVQPQALLWCPPGTIPVTSSGKPRRQRCLQLYRQDLASEPGQRRFQPWLSGDVNEQGPSQRGLPVSRREMP